MSKGKNKGMDKKAIEKAVKGQRVAIGTMGGVNWDKRKKKA